MANKEHLEIIYQGVDIWNHWRKKNLHVPPDLMQVDFTGKNLTGINLEDANLREAIFRNANLSRAQLCFSNLVETDFRDAELRSADITASDFSLADLTNAGLRDARLLWTIFANTMLCGTDFSHSQMGYTTFGNVDLSLAKGLESVRQLYPSTIGLDTLYKSSGQIPHTFLEECGIPEEFITFIPSHFGSQQAILFYSCFISYSTNDEEFAKRLYSRMRYEKLRVWFAPEDMKGGRILHEQIEQAIQMHDRLLVILSEESMSSEWVKREIRNARRAEQKENRRKLFPIRLVDYETVKEWKGFDGDGGEDLAFELGKYYIPDFSNWKDYNSFEIEFAKLLRDLRAEEKK